MKKPQAKSISNILKLLVVIFIFFEYHYQSILKGGALSSDDCKGLLFIAIAGFFILAPIDASIFIQNLYKVKNSDVVKDIQNNQSTEIK